MIDFVGPLFVGTHFVGGGLFVVGHFVGEAFCGGGTFCGGPFGWPGTSVPLVPWLIRHYIRTYVYTLGSCFLSVLPWELSFKNSIGSRALPGGGFGKPVPCTGPVPHASPARDRMQISVRN